MATAGVLATMQCIRGEHSLDILGEANERERHHDWNLPSWSPDFSVSRGRGLGLIPGMVVTDAIIRDVNATSGLKPQVDFEASNGRVLRLEIIKFLEPLADFELGAVGSGDEEDLLREWQLVAIGHRSIGPYARHAVFTDQYLFTEAFRRTVCFGKQLLKPDTELAEIIDGLQEPANAAEQLPEGAILREAFFSGNWRIFLAYEGITGMAPAATEEGDQLCFIPGSRVPFMVRQRPGNEEDYSLVGVCFVYGYMHGRIVEDLQQGKVKGEVVNLY